MQVGEARVARRGTTPSLVRLLCLEAARRLSAGVAETMDAEAAEAG